MALLGVISAADGACPGAAAPADPNGTPPC